MGIAVRQNVVENSVYMPLAYIDTNGRLVPFGSGPIWKNLISANLNPY
jgi:hypothetical protein